MERKTITEAMRRVTWTISGTLTPAMRRLGWVAERAILRMEGDPLHRSDGRLRRTGRRHRGTRAWHRRMQ